MKGKKDRKRRAFGIMAAIGLGSICIGSLFHLRNELEIEKIREERLTELEEADGNYVSDAVILKETTAEEAEFLAEKLGAKVRLTPQEDFAVLYLPENVTIEEVYHSEEYEKYLEGMSADYKVSLAAVDANKRQLYEKKPQYSVNDTYYSNQEYLNYLNLNTSWKKAKGKGVTIAVIDTGIDTDHKEFVGKSAKNPIMPQKIKL